MANVDANVLLKIADSGDFLKFLHLTVDDLVKKKKILQNNEHYNNDLELTKEEFEKAVVCVQTLYRHCMVNNNEVFEIKAELSEATVETIRKCFEIRKAEIKHRLSEERLMQQVTMMLRSIDWKVKWVVGSSNCANLSEPLMQIDMNCSETENEHNIVNFEMKYDQVDRLIAELEEFKAKISQQT